MPNCLHSLQHRRTFAACFIALGASACGPGTTTPPLADGGTESTGCSEGASKTILQQSFDNFTNWTSFDLGADAGGDGLGNVGDRIVYISNLPAHGSTEFPVGTLLVKTAGADTANPGPTFAMAKVGGCYNQTGAKDWEWFELQVQTTGATQIIWRGLEAPAGDTYNNQAPNSCNACHASFSANDYVPSAPLSLTNF
jgi:hypothetical protein